MHYKSAIICLNDREFTGVFIHALRYGIEAEWRRPKAPFTIARRLCRNAIKI